MLTRLKARLAERTMMAEMTAKTKSADLLYEEMFGSEPDETRMQNLEASLKELMDAEAGTGFLLALQA